MMRGRRKGESTRPIKLLYTSNIKEKYLDSIITTNQRGIKL